MHVKIWKYGNYAYAYMLSYVPTSKFSIAKLACYYRKYCSCKLKHVVKFQCQIYIYTNVHEQSEICPWTLKTLLMWFDKLARCRRGYFDGIFVGLLFMSGTSKLKATHFASYKHLKPFETLGCSGYLQVCKWNNENWTGYVCQQFLHLIPMGFLCLSKTSN